MLSLSAYAPGAVTGPAPGEAARRLMPRPGAGGLEDGAIAATGWTKAAGDAPAPSSLPANVPTTGSARAVIIERDRRVTAEPRGTSSAGGAWGGTGGAPGP